SLPSFLLCFFSCDRAPRALHSFPTRRSSDLQAQFAFAGGVRGSGDWCFCSDARRDTVEIEGSRGRLAFATFDEVPVTLETGAESRSWSIDNPRHIQQPLIETVVAALRGQGECPSTGTS